MTSPALKPLAFDDPDELQRRASNPQASVWVNASAGSGKTSVLTKRVMRLLLSGVRPQKILCLTYTRAGAAEMSNRIASILSKWATCDDKTLVDDLDALQKCAPDKGQMMEARRLFARVLSCPGGLRIRTIHSFCQEILSRFPLEAGLPPHISLIEGQELDTLKNDVLDDLLREAADDPVSELAQSLSALTAQQSEAGFSGMLKEISGMRGRFDGSDKAGLIAKTRRFLDLSVGETPESFRRDALRGIPEADLRSLAKWLSTGSKTHQERARVLADILALSEARRDARFEDYCGLFLTKKNTPLKAFANKEVLQKHPEIETISEREALRLLSFLERIEAAEIARTTDSVLSFGLAFAKRLAERKALRAVLDYEDMILFTEALLRKKGIAPWILYKLDNGIDHILLDEAQDTSRAQWTIVQSLTDEFFSGLGARGDRDRTLFVVGDEKQSIFSFQNADPEAFLSLHNYFSRRLADAGKKLEPIPMRTSFRSAPAVLKAVDAIFADDTVRKGVSEETIAHVSYRSPGGPEKIGRVEVWPLFEKTAQMDEVDGKWLLPITREDDDDPQAALAEAIALKIEGWINRKEALAGESNPIAAGDIMILLRNRGRFADLMVRALKARKVPVTGVDRMTLVDQLPVMDLLALVRFVLLPEDDLNLAALLKSPFIGFDEDDLMAVAVGRGDSSLWSALRANGAYAGVCDYLEARLDEADFSTPFDFLSRVLNLPCPSDPVSGRKALWARLGDEALDPIEELLNKAQGFGQARAPSLQNFLHWLAQSEADIKRELDRTEAQVRIMTVHASKGLEAPIVFLPDTTSEPRPQDLSKFQWSENGAPLFMRRKPEFGAALRLWMGARDRQLEEYRRLFYVALTRASRRLVVCGWKNGKASSFDASWYGMATSGLRPFGQEICEQASETPAPDIVFADVPISAPKILEPARSVRNVAALPAWATSAVREEAVAARRPPPSEESVSSATPDAAFARGRIIHRLLQSLPDIAPEKRDGAISRFLSQPRHALATAARKEIANEVRILLNDEKFAALFGPGSVAEAALTGRIGNVTVFRQVDRLCVRGNDIWIVDYKTNRPPPENEKDVPAPYRRQMEEYRILLQGLYPGKNVRCFLLWTYAPRLMEIAPLV